MAKQITFNFEGTDYVLEYTRRTVKQMEAEGFVSGEIDSKPMSLLPALFAGAFKAHHRFVKPEVIDRIYVAMPDKEGLIGRLAEMYNEPILTLLEEPEDKPGKKVLWTATLHLLFRSISYPLMYFKSWIKYWPEISVFSSLSNLRLPKITNPLDI